MFSVPTSEGETFETHRNSPTFTHTKVEMGTHQHGLCRRFTLCSNQLSKSVHFLAFHGIFSLDRLAKLYIDEIVKLQGVLMTIVLERDPRFISRFLSRLQKASGTTLHFSTAFHSQIDGQSEKTI